MIIFTESSWKLRVHFGDIKNVLVGVRYTKNKGLSDEDFD